MEIPAELLELADWFELLVSGKTDEDIASETALPIATIALGRAALLEREQEAVSRSVEVQYAEYRLRIEGVLRSIDNIHEIALNPGRNNGKMSLKTAADILVAKAKIIDQTVARGQELGILPKAALNKNVKVSGGIMLGAMPTQELLSEMVRLKNEGERLLVDYREVPFASMGVPDIYEGSEIVMDDAPSKADAPKVNRKKH